LELRVPRLSFLQDVGVGVGVFPNGKEIMVGGFAMHNIAGDNVYLPSAQMARDLCCADPIAEQRLFHSAMGPRTFPLTLKCENRATDCSKEHIERGPQSSESTAFDS
jgi:hypothetical protein